MFIVCQNINIHEPTDSAKKDSNQACVSISRSLSLSVSISSCLSVLHQHSRCHWIKTCSQIAVAVRN